MMSDYIKREDAIKALEGWKISGEMILEIVPSADVVEVDKVQKEVDYWHDLAQSYEQTITKLTLCQADVVEVVRCKDCKHNYRRTTFNHGKRDNPSCKYTNYVRDNDFYCSYGERADT